MNPSLSPTLDELADAVRSVPRLAIVGAETKLRVSASDLDGRAPISTRQLQGIVEYEPEEFVITALAGTPVREIAAELGRHGQYLPFEPLLAQAGSTLGGVVATATNGPGRFRYGGVRDFILGVRFVNGTGELLRAGSKVVKNAAGFDLPKFFTGSRGGFALLAEVTLKVFPRPKSELTLRLSAASPQEAAAIISEAGRSRWQPHALDFPPTGGAVLVRLAGPDAALEPMAREVLARWPGEILEPEAAAAAWTELTELQWAHPDGIRFKLALPAASWPAIIPRIQSLGGGRVHITAGGDAAYASWPAGTDEASVAAALSMPGVTAGRLDRLAPLPPGDTSQPAILKAVKVALDPAERFLLPTLP